MILERPHARFPEPRRAALRAALVDEARAATTVGAPSDTARGGRDTAGGGHAFVVDRARSRRRYLAFAGLAVAACLVAASAVWVLQRGPVTTAGPPAAVQPTPAVGSPTASPTPMTAVTPAVLASILTSLLPTGQISNLTGDLQPGGGAYVSLVFDDGRGASRVDVSIAAGDQGPCAGEGTAGCATRADGSTILTLDQREYPAQNRGSTERYVALYRDGMTLTFSEWNAPTSKDSPITRAEPPLTLDQATAVLDSPLWSARVPVTVAEQAAAQFTPSAPPTS